MLWPLILPFKITFWSLLAVVVLTTLAAPLFKWRRQRAYWWALGLSLLAFVPSCTVIMNVLDAKRFGVFTYAAFNDVQDFRVTRYLPPTAHDISVEKQRQGFRAQYKITEAELKAYVDDLWDKYGDRSNASREVIEDRWPSEPKMDADEFDDLGWPFMPDARNYNSPRAGNGAGFIIWYSPSTGIAYERADYW